MLHTNNYKGIKNLSFCFVIILALFPILMANNTAFAVIQISSIEQLQSIGNDPNYPLSEEYELTQDIDASDTINWENGFGFKPIGNHDNPFTGKLDSKGHKVRKLYINRDKENGVGLFGYIGKGGEVLNLGLENCQIIGGDNTGTLAGVNRGTVSNCYATGSVQGSGSVGGLVGVNEYGMVSNCYATCSVSGTGSGRYDDERIYVGGLVGCNGRTSSYSGGSYEKSTVSNCYATGSVQGTGSGKYAEICVGGLVGYNGSVYSGYQVKSMIANCYATGDVYGNSTSYYKFYIGGLIGYFESGSISYCYSVGKVFGNGNKGGLLGYKGGDVFSSYWDIETSGQNNSAGGIGKTTEQMKQKTTYSGWDFSNIWAIQEGISYPWLKILGRPSSIRKREIWTLDDLNKIGKDSNYPINGYYILMADIDASDTKTWNDGKGFEPVRLFTGVFNGNGHKIQKLYVNRPSEEYIGLFRYTNGSAIFDLGLEDCQITGGKNTGIMIGKNLGEVSNCYATGSVSGSGNIGGLVGNNSGKVSNCYATSSVNGTGNGDWTTSVSVGGLVGWNDGGMMSNCYATGSVQGSGSVDYTYIGGLVGWNNGGTVSNCYATGSVQGNGKVGGLVGFNGYRENGYLEGGEEESRVRGTVSNCYATGNVSGIGNIGGLVGDNSGKVSNCYATGSVSGSGWYVGGLVGSNSGTVSNCYATGSVLGMGSGGEYTYVGGLVGAEWHGTVSNCYWDIETSGQTNSAGGEGKTTAQMKQKSTYVGWDFSNIWTIQEGITYPYFIQVSVPLVVGMSQSSASSAITSAGLVVGVVIQQCSDTVPAGTVISQAPTSGTQVNKGSPVDIIVSTGLCPSGEGEGSYEGTPEGINEGSNEGATEGEGEGSEGGGSGGTGGGTGGNVIVPNLAGLTQSSASSMLTSAGLKLGNVIQECSDTVPKDKIISQSPANGSQVQAGSAVDIVISTGPCEEGEGNPEGSNEGEGGGNGGGLLNLACGCLGNNKALGNGVDTWLKYLFDFVLMGMTIIVMSGTSRRKK